MRRWVLRHLTYANVVSTACLFIVLGGGAYAATTWVTSGGVLHGCVSRNGTLRLVAFAKKCPEHQVGIVWNQSGPAGNPGPAGQTGALGSQGLQGPQGNPGPSHAYSALATGVSVPAYPGVTAATLSLPAGSFSLAAKLYLRAENVGSYTWLANCTLAAGSDSDFAQAETEPTGGYDANIPMSLAVLHTFASPGSVTVSCYGQGASIAMDNVVVTAIQVGNIN